MSVDTFKGLDNLLRNKLMISTGGPFFNISVDILKGVGHSFTLYIDDIQG